MSLLLLRGIAMRGKGGEPPFCFLSFNFYCIPRRLSQPFFFTQLLLSAIGFLSHFVFYHATSTVSQRLSLQFCLSSLNLYCIPQAFSTFFVFYHATSTASHRLSSPFCFVSRNLSQPLHMVGLLRYLAVYIRGRVVLGASITKANSR